MSKPDMNDLFSQMGREPQLVESAAEREARRARVVGAMRETHVRLVHSRPRAFVLRRRVHVLAVAATLAIAGAALAGAATLGPLARFRSATGTAAAPPPVPAISSHSHGIARPIAEESEAAGERAPEPPSSVIAPPLDAASPVHSVRSSAPSARPARAGSVPERSGAESDLEVVNRMFAEAKQQRREGRDVSALALFERLLARYPRSVLAEEALVERMRLLVRLGRSADAERAAQRYLARYPRGFARGEAEHLAPSRTTP